MPLIPIRTLSFAIAVAALVGLAACDTAEERAEEHYQSGVALLEAGDVDRALVEFRNVFKLNGLHREARLAYAEVMREKGSYGEAYRHYLLLSEQYPNDPLPLKWLFRIATLGNETDQARTHGERAVRIAPEDPEVQAIGAILAYQSAVEADETAARRDAAAKLESLAGSIEDRQLVLPALVDSYVRDGELGKALDAVDALLSKDPSLESWQQLRLRILTELGDEQAVVDQLERLVELFPDSPDYPAALIQWYSSRNDVDAAESFLRKWVDAADPDAKADRQVQLVGFISSTRGPDAAIAELDGLIADAGEPGTFRAMRAGYLFDKGDRDTAIAEMEAIVAEGTGGETARTDPEFLEIEVNLARMLLATGQKEEAQARVDDVLAKDGGQVGALKLRSARLIEQDRVDEAIVALRNALGRSSEDPELMRLIAEAHMRNGSRSLAGEMLALAVEASDSDPDYTLALARFLLADEDYISAENVLMAALRKSPSNVDLIAQLGQLYIARTDWSRATEAESRLRRIGTEAALARADALRVAWLRAQERGQEALRFLTELADADDGNAAARIAVARTHMENGNYDHAEAYINARLAENRRDPVMRMLQAALYAQTNRGEKAEEVLRALVKEDPNREIVWRTLYETKLRLGEVEDARAILNEALAVLPEAPDLLWAKAGELERDGDIDGAIGIYTTLYDRLSSSPIVANNLASLLSSRGSDDPETLDRAYTIARRLRGSDVPAFQDTYGWIAHLRGETAEALAHLEPAAAAIPEDATVQFHLGMAYSAAGRLEAAAEHLQRALELAGPRAEEAPFDDARTELAAVEARVAQQPEDN